MKQPTEKPHPRDDGRIRTGVRGDQNRMTSFRFAFSDGVQRTFYDYTEERALVVAKVWGLAHGGLAVQEGGAR